MPSSLNWHASLENSEAQRTRDSISSALSAPLRFKNFLVRHLLLSCVEIRNAEALRAQRTRDVTSCAPPLCQTAMKNDCERSLIEK